MSQSAKPIGVFDSGVGGLTVLKALKEACPNEDFVYLGDTARLPYGTKSKETVIQYALNGAQMVMEQEVKCLVVACNTASSVALPALRTKFPGTPIIGVIEPGAQVVHQRIAGGKILVLATEGTTRWHAYQQALLAVNPELEVVEWPCPLFVALAEEGWTHGPLVKDIVKEVLKSKLQETYAGVLLGCTHFPLLEDVIQDHFQGVPIINSAQAVAASMVRHLAQENLANQQDHAGQIQFFATDGLERFATMAKRFMGIDIPHTQVALVSPKEWASVQTPNAKTHGS